MGGGGADGCSKRVARPKDKAGLGWWDTVTGSVGDPVRVSSDNSPLSRLSS